MVKVQSLLFLVSYCNVSILVENTKADYIFQWTFQVDLFQFAFLQYLLEKKDSRESNFGVRYLTSDYERHDFGSQAKPLALDLKSGSQVNFNLNIPDFDLQNDSFQLRILKLPGSC
jgi:hypothetical protein